MYFIYIFHILFIEWRSFKEWLFQFTAFCKCLRKSFNEPACTSLNLNATWYPQLYQHFHTRSYFLWSCSLSSFFLIQEGYREGLMLGFYHREKIPVNNDLEQQRYIWLPTFRAVSSRTAMRTWLGRALTPARRKPRERASGRRVRSQVQHLSSAPFS